MPRATVVLVLALLTFLSACSSPDEKKMRFYNKGKELMDRGELVKASLEMRNAIQIDPKFADAHYQLGLVELRKGNVFRAFECFQKVVQIAPDHLNGQVELGKLLLLLDEKGKAQAQEKADLVLKAQPGHREGMMLQAAIHMIRKEWEHGGEILERLIAGGVTKPDAYQSLALARRAMKDDAGAEATLKEGARRNPTSVGILKSLADLYAAKNRVDDAAGSISQMMRLEPAKYGYGITLAGLYWDAGRTADARALLAKLRTAYPKHEQCLLDLVRFYLLHRQQNEAEALLKEGIVNVPESFRLRTALSELYAATGRNEQATVLLKECIALAGNTKKPEAIQANNLLARGCFLRGDLGAAQEYLAEVLKASPRNIDATYLKGRIHLARREGLAAMTAFRTVTSDRPQEVDGYLFLADAQQINGEPKLALETLQLAERLEPDSLRVNRAFARLSLLQKEYHQGERRMTQYLERHPGDLEAQLELGDLHFLAGNYREAEAAYRYVKQKAPGSPLPYWRLSDLHAQEGNPARAASEMEVVVGKVSPDNVQASLALASLYARASQVSKAKKIYERLFASHQKEWRVVNDYAYFLAEHGSSPADLERAGQLVGHVARQRPDDPSVLDTLGWIEYKRGNYPKAMELLGKADARRPGHQTVNYHLGMACMRAGKKDQARNCLSKALAGGDFPEKRTASTMLSQL